MTIVARYAGFCGKCGGRIEPGQRIEWSRGGGSSHAECPAGEASPTAGAILLSRSSDSREDRPAAGDVLRDREGRHVVVTRVRSTYYREDGMSFGLHDDCGWLHDIEARPATDEEAAPLVAEEARRAARRAAHARSRAIARQIEDEGEMPSGEHVPTGERLMSTATIYGGGDWFVVGPRYIWYVRNNGADGDDWRRNNVRTGGAGAIGSRVPATVELADELRSLDATIKGAAR